jgi:hypothetical protein
MHRYIDISACSTVCLLLKQIWLLSSLVFSTISLRGLFRHTEVSRDSSFFGCFWSFESVRHFSRYQNFATSGKKLLLLSHCKLSKKNQHIQCFFRRLILGSFLVWQGHFLLFILWASDVYFEFMNMRNWDSSAVPQLQQLVTCHGRVVRLPK